MDKSHGLRAIKRAPKAASAGEHVGQLQGDLCAARTEIAAAATPLEMIKMQAVESRSRPGVDYLSTVIDVLLDARSAIDCANTEADEIEFLLLPETEVVNG